VLRKAPTSRLVLKSLPFADEAVRKTVQQRFTDAGIAPGRVDILPPSIGEDFLAEYSRIDIALDTFPYNGGTTTFEAVWMGVPVLTLAGERFCSRMAASVLLNIGMDEMVTDSPTQYVQVAIALAADPSRVERLRHRLRERLAASPCCDGPRTARKLEAALRKMVVNSG
jgi:predicted O-linked N-acetylglucosamine transferase (SPINDLY family)